MDKAANRLADIGGEQVIEFFISNVETADCDSWARDASALALAKMKAHNVVDRMLAVIWRPENVQAAGTLVYALREMNCSTHFTDMFRIVFTYGFEAAVHAFGILNDQHFSFNQDDLREVQQMWDECCDHPENSPAFEDLEDEIRFVVDNYLCYLESLNYCFNWKYSTVFLSPSGKLKVGL